MSCQQKPTQGARFTKISDDGQILPREATDWTVVHDALLQLFWLRRSIRGKNHAACMKAAAKVSAAGLEGWRPPTRIEMLSLVDETRHSPAIDVEYFPECESDWFWTSTPAACSPSDYAWDVYFGNGYADWYVQDSNGFVRAVRAGQLSDLGPGGLSSGEAA